MLQTPDTLTGFLVFSWGDQWKSSHFQSWLWVKCLSDPHDLYTWPSPTSERCPHPWSPGATLPSVYTLTIPLWLNSGYQSLPQIQSTAHQPYLNAFSNVTFWLLHTLALLCKSHELWSSCTIPHVSSATDYSLPLTFSRSGCSLFPTVHSFLCHEYTATSFKTKHNSLSAL